MKTRIKLWFRKVLGLDEVYEPLLRAVELSILPLENEVKDLRRRVNEHLARIYALEIKLNTKLQMSVIKGGKDG